jgi:hypothetical protein
VSEECETQFQRDKLLIGCKIEEKRRGQGNGMERAREWNGEGKGMEWRGQGNGMERAREWNGMERAREWNGGGKGREWRGQGNGMEGVGVNEGRSLPCPTCHVVSCSAVCYA